MKVIKLTLLLLNITDCSFSELTVYSPSAMKGFFIYS